MHDILATFNKSSCLNISLSKREVNPAIIINICDSVTGDEWHLPNNYAKYCSTQIIQAI